MAPRRNNSGGPTTLDIQNLFGLDQQQQHSIDSSFDSSQIDGKEICCVPNGECLRSNSPDYGYILPSDIPDAIRVICNNESCTAGQYMHRKCFEAWEQTVLSYLKSIGRARSWSEKQRQQNLWNKKGYDLVFKACGCKCGRGHLKKDLDWIPPTLSGMFGKIEEDSSKKKKKRNRNNQKPTLAISTSPNNYHPNSQIGKLTGIDNLIHGIMEPTTIRGRAGSLSSNGSSSSPVSSSEQSISPIHTSCGNNSSSSSSDNKQQLKSQIELYSEKVR
jgi:headcase protein